MGNVVRPVVALALAALLVACGSPRESDVYDWMADQILQHDPVFVVASAADARWFQENSLDDVVREGTASRGTEPPWLLEEQIPLLRRLFEANAADSAIPWTPSDPRIRLLPGDYRAVPRSKGEVDRMCFSAQAMPPVGLSKSPDNSGAFRPYVSLSRVAFSEDGQFAIVKIALACAPLNGAHERIVILGREGEGWRVVGGALLWIS